MFEIIGKFIDQSKEKKSKNIQNQNQSQGASFSGSSSIEIPAANIVEFYSYKIKYSKLKQKELSRK